MPLCDSCCFPYINNIVNILCTKYGRAFIWGELLNDEWFMKTFPIKEFLGHPSYDLDTDLSDTLRLIKSTKRDSHYDNIREYSHITYKNLFYELYYEGVTEDVKKAIEKYFADKALQEGRVNLKLNELRRAASHGPVSIGYYLDQLLV